MKTNTLLTYLLYALLTGLIGIAGYKACQMKRDQARSAQEDAEFQKTLHDLGYVEGDSTGSQYTGEGTTTTTATPSPAAGTPAVSKDGIESEDPTPATTPKTTSPAPVKTLKESAPALKPAAPAATQSITSAKKTPINLDTDTSSGRYRVIAGSFLKLDGARRQMEKIIQMGYQEAEIGYMNKHKYAVVVVKRTNSLADANKIVTRLKSKSIDASVMDKNRKK